MKKTFLRVICFAREILTAESQIFGDYAIGFEAIAIAVVGPAVCTCLYAIHVHTHLAVRNVVLGEAPNQGRLHPMCCLRSRGAKNGDHGNRADHGKKSLHILRALDW